MHHDSATHTHTHPKGDVVVRILECIAESKDRSAFATPPPAPRKRTRIRKGKTRVSFTLVIFFLL